MAHKELVQSRTDSVVVAKLMSDFSSKIWSEFRYYIGHISDNSNQLDTELTFYSEGTEKKDYASKTLAYPLEKGDYSSFDKLIGTLYEPEERAKLEWAIGAIVTGDAKYIQKFIVMYGEGGSGKSTILNIIMKLFEGYHTTFEAKALTASNNQFSTEVFKHNPLVAIQHDGDLSKIEDNAKLNSIVSHEEMTMNEKYKPSYTSRLNAFLFMGTNRPVKITDAKSGIIRRLIDVKPSGKRIAPHKYEVLVNKIDFELGAIAYHCMEVYNSMGKNYYTAYKPLDMIFKTDTFFNFVENQYYVFKDADGVSLKQAYTMYKEYCDEALVQYKAPRHKFREELKDYFGGFADVARVDGKQVRSYYTDFLSDKFARSEEEIIEEVKELLELNADKSIFDTSCLDCPAQYASKYETPKLAWSKVESTLSELDTRELHYVKVPKNHIVIDFDIPGPDGEKSLEKNLEAASKWPPTYTELSKSGKGVHLHYIYDGDVDRLANVYANHIEIKVFRGKSSLRRRLTKCNDMHVQVINSGLPTKGDKVINKQAVKSERTLRRLINSGLKKEVHPGTKASVDFIHMLLTEAYESGMKYDVTNMRPKILAFANNSTNQSPACLKLVTQMPFKSEEPSTPETDESAEIAFFDVEVFPNLLLIDWKFRGKPNHTVLINPKPAQIEELLSLNLVGFNNRRYDNHILYAAYLGYGNAEIYELSQRIISGSKNGTFAEAYGLSCTDILDFSSKKQSLKKFQIELGIHHLELGLPWDEPVDKKLWDKVGEYCKNDVDSTEAVFESKDRQADFTARQIIADMCGLTVNDTTQRLAARVIFGTDRNPQKKFVYTDLSEEFPGYEYSFGKSTYRDEVVGEGGYVYGEPGMYGNVGLDDVESEHPWSLIILNHFGPYTQRFKELLDARVAIKHGQYDIARTLLNGSLKKYLKNDADAKPLSYALKIIINIVYGMTSAKFDNPFKDPRNVDNIVAKRGALFMIDLKHAVQEQGYTVAHIKTDSIKVPDTDPEITKFIHEFGKKYGYKFEHEAEYDKMCLVNDAVYIAKYKEKDGKPCSDWTATGTQFKQPYVFKKLFSGDKVEFEDLCETKTVKSSLYLDMNENMPDVTMYETEMKDRTKDWYTDNPNKLVKNRRLYPELSGMSNEQLIDQIEKGHNYHFVGKAGAFTPIKDGCGAGVLLREKDGKFYAASGSKGHRWLESEMVEKLEKKDDIDLSYYEVLKMKAKADIETYGDYEWFASEQPYTKENNGIIPF